VLKSCVANRLSRLYLLVWLRGIVFLLGLGLYLGLGLPRVLNILYWLLRLWLLDVLLLSILAVQLSVFGLGINRSWTVGWDRGGTSAGAGSCGVSSCLTVADNVEGCENEGNGEEDAAMPLER